MAAGRFSIRWGSIAFMKQADLKVAVVLVGLLVAGCDEPLDPEPTVEHSLMFVSSQKDVPGEDIYRMKSDGTGRENLTRLSTVQFPTFELAVTYRSIALAPDGQRIAFETNREGCAGIWGMNTDGTAIRKLSTGELLATRCNYFPVWSPDGTSIAFTTTREGRFSVYVMNADGTNPRNVSSPLDQQDGVNFPVGWSPDGRVVFHHPTGDGRFQAYVVKPDGTGLGLLFGRAGDHSPEWSPDRSKVAFIRDTQNGSSLFVMNANGSDVHQLTNHAGQDLLWPENFQNDYSNWSPDGRRFVYINRIDSRNELHVISSDGTGDVRLTSYDADFNGWSPDGRVTFSSDVNGSDDLYLIASDGTGLVNLTNTTTSNEVRALWVSTK